MYYYDYSKILGKFSGFNDTYKKKREFKKDFEKLIKKSRKPISIKVGASLTNIFKTRKMQVSVSNKDIDKFEEKKDVVISAFDKIPMNAKAFYGKALQYLITEDSNCLKEYISKGTDFSCIPQVINNFFEWKITNSEFEKYFKVPDDLDENSTSVDWRALFEGGGKVGARCDAEDPTEYNKMKNAISSLITPTELNDKEESIKKGKKINPNFIKKHLGSHLLTKRLKQNKKRNSLLLLTVQEVWGVHTIHTIQPT